LKKIVVITPGNLPFPPFNGGAIENLLQTIVLQNEKEKFYQLLIYTIRDKRNVSLNFTLTDVIQVKSNTFKYIILKRIRFLVNSIFKNLLPNQFLYSVLKDLSKRKDYDFILLENNPHFSKFIKKKISVPIILHLHNMIEMKTYSSFIDHCICVSHFLKKKIELDLKKTYVIHNGIDLKRFNSDISIEERNRLRKNLGLEHSDLVICYAGRIDPTKGIDYLLSAFNKIHNTPNLKLLIIGSSKFANSKLMIKESKTFNNKIVYTGYIDYDQIHMYYKICDFSVLPSIIEEGFGLTALESIASGLPVIISDSGAMNEIINENCGIIISRNISLKENLISSIYLLANNSNLRLRMSEFAKERSKIFSKENYYNNFRKFINKISHDNS
jgi:spore coat protein SA